MEREKAELFKEITSEEDESKILLYLQKTNFNLDLSIDTYYQDIHKQNLTQELLLKRKQSTTHLSISIGMFESDAYAISTVSNITIGSTLAFKLPKPRQLISKRKEIPDRTIRFALEPNGFSFGKIPQTLADFLFPLITGNLIQIEGYILEAPSSISLLDVFKIGINIILREEAISDPNMSSEDIKKSRNISSEEYNNQRESVLKLFEMVKLQKTQEVMKKDEIGSDCQEEIGNEIKVDTSLFLENLNTDSSEMSPPFTFRTQLYPYQKQALAWMYERESSRAGNRNSRELHHL